jgi:hypothetical protein
MYFGPVYFAPADDFNCEIPSVHAGAEKVPQFTFNLSGNFVNVKSPVSTGFCGFFWFCSGFSTFSPEIH